jgi:hypothetical protein
MRSQRRGARYLREMNPEIPPGLKSISISGALCGAEGPLFHCGAGVLNLGSRSSRRHHPSRFFGFCQTVADAGLAPGWVAADRLSFLAVALMIAMIAAT